MYELTDAAERLLENVFDRLETKPGRIDLAEDDPDMRKYEALKEAGMIKCTGAWGTPVIIIWSVTPKGIEHINEVKGARAMADKDMVTGAGGLCDELSAEALGTLLGLDEHWQELCGGLRCVSPRENDPAMEYYRELSRAGMISFLPADDIVYAITEITPKGRRCINEARRAAKEEGLSKRWKLATQWAGVVGAFVGAAAKGASE
jgi:hypothetical protein